MTEKNQQNQTKNLLKSLNAASVTPPINRAANTLPQATALKARFRAGSIPLETDFADLIDIASIGRQAVGGAEGQTGPADGLTLSETGCLELKANPVKGIYADKDGVAIRVGDGLKVDGRGVFLPLGWGLKYGGAGLDINCKSAGGLDANSSGTWVVSGNGIHVDTRGVNVKGGNGIAVDSNGVNVKGGNGIAVDSNNVSVKLARGAKTNGGEGHGADSTTDGGAGGLFLEANGLSVDAGDGLQINQRGVSIKLASSSGLRADESNGLRLKAEKNKGLQVSEAGVSACVGKGMRISDTGMIEPAIESYAFSKNENGTKYSPLKVNSSTNELVVNLNQGLVDTASGLSVKTGNGLITNTSGANVKLAKGEQTNGGGGQGADNTTAGAAGGLFLDANGLSVDAGDGMQINAHGVSIKLANNSGLRVDEENGLSLQNELWIKTMCQLHGATYYCYEHGIAVFICTGIFDCAAYVYGRNGKFLHPKNISLHFKPLGKHIPANEIAGTSMDGKNIFSASIVRWQLCSAGEDYTFDASVVDNRNSNIWPVSLEIKAAP